MAEEPITQRIELPIPDVGLSKAEVDELANAFKASLVEKMATKKALMVRPVIIVVVPVAVVIHE